jgi:hypothetical protein
MFEGGEDCLKEGRIFEPGTLQKPVNFTSAKE